MRFAFLGYNFRPQQYFIDPPQWREPSFELIRDDVGRARSVADVIVVTLHWGDEFVECPAPDQVALAHSLVDHGVDVIIGHHTHMIQGVEEYRGGLIAYGLGNFVYDQWQPRLRRSMILQLSVHGPRSISHRAVPVLINGLHQPEILTGTAAERATNVISLLGQQMGQASDDTYRRHVQRQFQRFRHEVYLHYLTHVFHYRPRDLFANLVGAIQRRM